MFNSFEQAVEFIISNGIYAEFKMRIGSIFQETVDQKWINQYEFERIISRLEF
jgi:hypothetical protein